MRPPASHKNARPKPKSVHHIDTLLRQKRYREALEAVAPLAKQFPDHPGVTMQYGSALAWTSHFVEAEPLLLKALKHYPNKTSLLTLLSRCYFETERYLDAERVLNQAFEQAPEYLDALYMLGRVKAEQGDHRAAEDAFRRAVAKAPESGSLNYALALYHSYLPTDEIFKTLPTEVKAQRHSYFERVLGHFALGKAYWDIEQHEKAFQWFTQGNELVVKEGKVLDKHFNVKYQLSHLVKGVKKESVERIANPERLAFPHIVIVGVSRSGKSLVESLLTTGTDIAPLGESTVLVDYVNDILKAYDGDVVNYVQTATPATSQQHAKGYLALWEGKPLSTLTLPEHISFLGVLVVVN